MVQRRLVLVAGPSGSGKSRLVLNSGLPQVRLDDFLANRFGRVYACAPHIMPGPAGLAPSSKLGQVSARFGRGRKPR